MADITLFLCGTGEGLELIGFVETRDEPGRDEGCCDHCGEPLGIDRDDGEAEYTQACGYCGRPIYRCDDDAR